MTDQPLLHAISLRSTFNMFANAFRQNGLDVVGQGWIATKGRLEALLADEKTGAASREVLQNIYLENVLYTHKAVSLWAIDAEVAERLMAALERMINNDSPYLSSYPYPLAEAELGEVGIMGIPTAVHNFGDCSTLVFASKRIKTEEEVMDISSMPEAYRSAGYTEMVAKKKLTFQVFDSVTVSPKLGLVEIRVDLAKGMPEQHVFNYREGIRSRFNNLAKEAIGIDNVLGTAVNLHDALLPLYKGSGWTVSRIDHINEGGYSNSNRGRYRTKDVRSDDYHKSGEAAVDHLQLWNVNAVFHSPNRIGTPMLILEGHSKMLSAQHPFMDIARLLDCAGQRDYRLLLDTMLECLKPQSATAKEVSETAAISMPPATTISPTMAPAI